MAEDYFADVWKKTLAQLRAQMREEMFEAYFSGTEYLRAAGGCVFVGVPTDYHLEKIKSCYQKDICAHLAEIHGGELSVDFEVKADILPKKDSGAETGSGEPTAQSGQAAAENAPAAAPGKPAQPEKKKKPRPAYLSEDYTFDKYVIGENNRYPAMAAVAISKNPGKVYNPFLIYGGVGMGKTHLMQAIGNYLYENTDKNIISITAEDFLNEYVQAISEGKVTRENKMDGFKKKFRNTDVLLIDDIQILTGKVGVQEELFHTYNALLSAKKQLVFTCDRHTSELKNFNERLLTRFTEGIIVDLQPPQYEERCAILKSTAKNRNVEIPDDVIDFVSKNISSNVRDLIGALNTLIAYTQIMEQPVTLEIAQKKLRDIIGSRWQSNLSLDNIIKVVAEYFHLSPSDLRGKKRSKKIVFPRQIAMYIAREITEYSTNEIGESFGGKDHATVIHSIEKIKGQFLTDPTLEITIDSLKRSIKESSAKTG